MDHVKETAIKVARAKWQDQMASWKGGETNAAIAAE